LSWSTRSWNSSSGPQEGAAPARKNPSGSLLLAVHNLRTVAVEIASAVGLEAQRAGLASKTSAEQLRARVAASQWTPEDSQLALGG
jgi:malate dehydrogenase (oxaloacetate-decarboxylating)